MIVDLFAGIGGWDLPARALGLDPVGLELDADACATRAAVGLTTIRADLGHYPIPGPGTITGLIASPPCQDFSVAGKKRGRTGSRGQLIDLVPAWVDRARPQWILCEQVPPALPIWKDHANAYTRAGYSVWTVILNSADYGIPQDRPRAILIATLGRVVLPPEPTHGKVPRGVLPWVTLAAALGWTETTRVGFPRRDDLGTSPDGYRERDWRTANHPGPAVTEKARSWTVNTGRDWKPGGTRADAQTIDAEQRPAPVLTGLSGSQWHLHRPDHETERLTEAQALTLQDFPPDYPVHGTRTSRFRQIGNAIPPGLACALLQAVI